jgi:hypothetical protein
MSGAAIRAGQAFYELMAEDKTKGGLDSAEARLKSFGARVGMVGAAMASFAAAGLSAIGVMVKAFAGAGDNISDAMNVTGLSSDFLQTLQFGAADAGVAFDALVAAVTKSNKLLSDAAGGGKSANAALAKLGLTAAGLMALSPDERFKALAEAIDRIPDPAQRAAAAMSVFGKSGAKLLPALEGGAAALNEQMAELQSKGLIMSDEDRQLAAKAEGAYLSLGLALSRVSQVIAAGATPAFLSVMDVMQRVVEGTVKFIDENRTLVAGITIGLGVIGAIGGALMIVGGALAMAGFAAGGLAMGFAAASTAIGVLLSPVALIVAAIAACGAAALVSAYYLDQLFNGGAALQFLTDMAAGAMTAMQALWTAISNGRWDLAGKLITDGLNVAFTSGILALKQAWVGFANWLTELLVGVMQGVVDTVAQGMDAMINQVTSKLGNSGYAAVARAAGVAVGVGAEVTGGSVKTTLKAANKVVLGDSQADVAKAAAALGKTMADIAALDSKRQEELKGKAADAGLADFGNVSNQMKQSSLISGSEGTFSSAAAMRLGQAAPQNVVEEQQLEALKGIEKGVGQVADRLEEAEGLVFD